jgi:hypothetical protein
MNVWMEEDLMLENLEKKSESIYYQNKYKLRKVKFLKDGLLKQQISSIKWLSVNLRKD